MPVDQVQANPAIRPKGPVTEADLQNIRDCFASGLGVRDTARKLGLSQNQITHAKRKYGLTSPVLNPKQHPSFSGATEASALKARRERHARRDRWVNVFELAMNDLEHDLTPGNKATTILKGAMGMEEEREVSKIPARDLRERFAAINVAETQIQKIDQLDDDQGLARGQSLLDRIFEDLGNKEITIRPGMVTQ